MTSVTSKLLTTLLESMNRISKFQIPYSESRSANVVTLINFVFCDRSPISFESIYVHVSAYFLRGLVIFGITKTHTTEENNNVLLDPETVTFRSCFEAHNVGLAGHASAR